MTALSPLRDGRITGSRVAGILGLSKYASYDSVLREMVRAHYGAESEFTGNRATEYGNAHEEDAREAYERGGYVRVDGEQGVPTLVLDAQTFIRHPDIGWIGVSPDGLVDADGMAEFKCPLYAKYTTAAEVPHYVAQIQLQLECTGRAWCDLAIWRTTGLIVDRVLAERGWMHKHRPALERFIADYWECCADPIKADPFLRPAGVA